MNDNFKDLKKRILVVRRIAKTKGKQAAIFISNTKKVENTNFYFTPVRETKNYIYFGVVLFDGSIARKIAKIIDGKFNIIFVDTEKKSYLNKKNRVVNVEKTIKQHIKKSYLRFFKANDLTVDAAEDFLGVFYKNDIRNLAGKKILIIGIGNIGFKLSLRLIERGCTIKLFRRNQKKLIEICKTINFIKPKGTMAKALPIKNVNDDLHKFDVVFCAANNENVLKISKKIKFKKNILLLDIGKGMFGSETLNLLNQKGINVHRLDVTPSLNKLLESNDTFKDFEKKKTFKVRKINNLRLISPGLLGQKNDLIVDNPMEPKFIYGICDGTGDFKRLSENNKIKIAKIASKKIKRKLLFY